jgi:hypothetical protein
MKLVLLIFSYGNKYKIAGNRLKLQANELNIFNEIIYLNEDTYPIYFKNFAKDHKKIVNKNTRGYGYWIWKPFILKWILNNYLEENDIVLYLDSGCEISKFGLDKFNNYIQKTKKNGAYFFSNGFIESSWTKRDLIYRLNAIKHENKKQIQATFFFIKNTIKERELVNEWFKIAIEENYHYLDDTPSLIENHKSFIEHRHDQSILSLLCNLRGYEVDKMSCLFNPKLYYKNSFILNYPIHAPRNFSNNSVFDGVIDKSEINKVLSSRNKYKYLLLNFYFLTKLIIFRSIQNIKSKWM